MSKGVWKTIALMALTVCALLGIGVLWALAAFSSNLKVIAEGAPICWGEKSRNFDSIAAAQMIGRLDLVSFLLTVAGLGLAVFAMMGWWLIRREAKDEARDVAAEEFRKLAQIYFKNQNGSGTNGGDNPQSVPHNDPAPAAHTSFDPASVSVAGAVEETGAQDDRPKRRSRRNSRAPADDSSSNG